MYRTLAGVLLLLSISPYAHAEKRIAITIDDFPGWQPVYEGRAERVLQSLATALKEKKAPSTGFVIGELATRCLDSKKALEAWAKAGFALGNHSWHHIGYSRSTSKFWEEIDRTEAVLKPLREKYGPWPRAFRFPMLDQGKTPDQEKAANRYFESTETALAHVSIDNSDWAFARAYDRARKSKNAKVMPKIAQLYREHLRECIRYAEVASERLFSRQIPQILLLHASDLNASEMPTILKDLEDSGYKFIKFEDALSDPAYAPYRHRIAWQRGDNFFEQMAVLLKKNLPDGPDRTTYKYFLKEWAPRLKKEGIEIPEAKVQ